MGLKAKLREDAEDYARSKDLWNEAKALLAAESSDDDAGSDGKVIVEDDFGMSHLHSGNSWYGDGYGGFGYGGW